jgi:hypothetical protein
MNLADKPAWSYPAYAIMSVLIRASSSCAMSAKIAAIAAVARFIKPLFFPFLEGKGAYLWL